MSDPAEGHCLLRDITVWCQHFRRQLLSGQNRGQNSTNIVIKSVFCGAVSMKTHENENILCSHWNGAFSSMLYILRWVFLVLFIQADRVDQLCTCCIPYILMWKLKLALGAALDLSPPSVLVQSPNHLNWLLSLPFSKNLDSILTQWATSSPSPITLSVTYSLS